MAQVDKMKQAFQKMQEFSQGSPRVYFQAGRGEASLKELIHSNGQKGEAYIFEFTIDSVTPLDGHPSNTVGQTVGYVQKPANVEYFLENMIRIMHALTGITYEDLEASAKTSTYKAEKIKAGILGPAAPWTPADEFISFVNAKADDKSLEGRVVKFSCKPSNKDPSKVFPSFYAAV